MKPTLKTHWPLWAALAAAAILKIALLAAERFPFNSDEAVVALMARHILQGNPPAFFYGQAYMGSLDAWLAAAVMLVTGQQPLAIRIVQTVLYLGTIATTWALGQRIYRSAIVAGSAAALLAIPTVTTTLYTTVSLGGYGEVLLASNLLILWTLRLREQGRPLEWVGWGFLSGLIFWAFGFIGVYIASCGLALAWPLVRQRRWRTLVTMVALMGVGFIIGAWPWWWFTLQNGLATLSELGGTHIASSDSTFLQQAGQHVVSLLLFAPTTVSGLRPPWSVEFLAPPLAPVGLGMTLGALGYAIVRQWRARSADDHAALGRGLLLGVIAVNVVGFIFTSFGNDPSGRYFLPFTIPLALFGGELLARMWAERPRFAQVALGAWLLFNLVSNLQIALAYPDQGPGFTTQFDPVAQVDRRYDPELIAFLTEQGETRGYGNYWVTFPLAFNSGEQLQYSARLPYHEDFSYTPRDDRYQPYIDAVAQAARVAYITTNHPALNAHITAEFERLDVQFEVHEIGDYTIFYDLSRVVRPQEIGLGESFAGYDLNDE